jgi:hypothetical protein
MKNAVFWEVATCRSRVKRRFGRTYRLHLQGRIIRERVTSMSRWLQDCLQPPAYFGSSLADFSTLKMEAIRSSETTVHTRSTRHHIPEDGIILILSSFPFQTFRCWITGHLLAIKIMVFRTVTTCSFIGGYHHFGGTYTTFLINFLYKQVCYWNCTLQSWRWRSHISRKHW